MPLPSLPVLLVAGAQSVERPIYGAYALAVSTAACLLADLAWFWAGRHFGFRILKLLCRISLSPDTCVRQTESVFERRGPATLVIARFVPGLATVAPPLAAALGFRLTTYLVYNGIGAALYCGAGLIGGFIFYSQIDWLLERLGALGGHAMIVVALLFALYIAYRWWDRYRFMKTLRTARISVHAGPESARPRSRRLLRMSQRSQRRQGRHAAARARHPPSAASGWGHRCLDRGGPDHRGDEGRVIRSGY